MQTEELIQVDTFCVWHNVEYAFINKLQEYGLIEITTKEDQAFISESHLKEVEKLIRMYNDLQVNLEGMDVINYLLEQLKQRQKEITLLQNRLRFYES